MAGGMCIPKQADKSSSRLFSTGDFLFAAFFFGLAFTAFTGLKCSSVRRRLLDEIGIAEAVVLLLSFPHASRGRGSVGLVGFLSLL